MTSDERITKLAELVAQLAHNMSQVNENLTVTRGGYGDEDDIWIASNADWRDEMTRISLEANELTVG